MESPSAPSIEFKAPTGPYLGSLAMTVLWISGEVVGQGWTSFTVGTSVVLLICWTLLFYRISTIPSFAIRGRRVTVMTWLWTAPRMLDLPPTGEWYHEGSMLGLPRSDDGVFEVPWRRKSPEQLDEITAVLDQLGIKRVSGNEFWRLRRERGAGKENATD